MKKFVLACLVVSTAGQSLSTNAWAGSRREDAGSIIGGIVGGIIGNQVGDNRTVGTVIGVIAGAVIGHQIGRALDQADRRAYADAQRQCLEGSLNERRRWDGSNYGSRTGAYGEFVTMREGRHLTSNSVCREYESVIVQGGRREVTRGYACRKSDGSWFEVKEREVSFRGVVVDREETIRRGDEDRRRRDHRRDDNRYDDRNNDRHEDYDYDRRPTPVYDYERQDLSGYCEDYDHSQFMLAKDFAYSSSGLNYSSQDATSWALKYNERHACGTIHEYKSRYIALYDLAYSSTGFNLSFVDARNYALSRVETISAARVQSQKRVYQSLYNFAYSSSGLNLPFTSARDMARSWIERRSCEGVEKVQEMQSVYSREYSFAYSSSGLNMSFVDARNYALQRVRPLTRCGDLLRAY